MLRQSQRAAMHRYGGIKVGHHFIRRQDLTRNLTRKERLIDFFDDIAECSEIVFFRQSFLLLPLNNEGTQPSLVIVRRHPVECSVVVRLKMGFTAAEIGFPLVIHDLGDRIGKAGICWVVR